MTHRRHFTKGVPPVSYDRPPVSLDGSHIPLRPAEARVRLNDVVVARLVAALELGASDKIACSAAGMHLVTLCTWKEKAREIARQLDEGELKQEDLTYQQQGFLNFITRYDAATSKMAIEALNAIRRTISDDNWLAAKWYLESQHEYMPASAVSVRGAGKNGAIKVEHTAVPLADTLTPDQRAQLEALRLTSDED